MSFGMTFGSILYHAQGNTSGIGFERKPSEEVCMPEGKIHPNHFWLLLCVPLYIAAYNVYFKVSLSLNERFNAPANTSSPSLRCTNGYLCFALGP